MNNKNYTIKEVLKMKKLAFSEVIKDHKESFEQLPVWKQQAIEAIYNGHAGTVVGIHYQNELVSDKNSPISKRAAKDAGLTEIKMDSYGAYRIGVTAETYAKRREGLGLSVIPEKDLSNIHRLGGSYIGVHDQHWITNKEGDKIGKSPDTFYLYYDKQDGLYSCCYKDQNGDSIENIRDYYKESSKNPSSIDYGFRRLGWNHVAGVKYGGKIYGDY